MIPLWEVPLLYPAGLIVTVMLGADWVLPTIDPGAATSFTRIQLGKALALNPNGVAPFELTVRVCDGGAGLLFAATQKLRLVGLTLIELFWAIAVSRQPKAINSTSTVNVIVLKEMFTEFSTSLRRHGSIVSNPDATWLTRLGLRHPGALQSTQRTLVATPCERRKVEWQ